MSSTDSQTTSEPSPRQPAARDYRQEVTDNIIHLLEQGVAPWQKPWEAGASLGMPMNPTTGKSYRGGNAIHLMTMGLRKGYGDPRWMTYKQASEQGWQVRKGEKGTHIEFWDIQGGAPKARDPDTTGTEQGRDKTCLIHRVYTVFNAQQIDGIRPTSRNNTRPSRPFKLANKSYRTPVQRSCTISLTGLTIVVPRTGYIFHQGRPSETLPRFTARRCMNLLIFLATPRD
jgi:antirestriction protein ArdC